MAEIEARLKETIQRTYNVKSFRLEIKERLDFRAGQFLQVTLEKNPQLRRYLSISSSPTEKGFLEFTKKITESDFSKTLNSLQPGGSVNIKYPFGDFVLKEPCHKIAFLCGGIGITPVRSMLKFAADKNLAIDITLLYANRTPGDIAFRDDLEAIQRQYGRLKIVHVLLEGAGVMPCRQGLINSLLLKEEIPDYPARKFYLCGPPGMVEALQKMLAEELYIGKESIITENFQGY